jgi:hypothetical protein
METLRQLVLALVQGEPFAREALADALEERGLALQAIRVRDNGAIMIVHGGRSPWKTRAVVASSVGRLCVARGSALYKWIGWTG